ncbi:MAG: CHASE4 domain-containing protein [Woeseia sp.]
MPGRAASLSLQQKVSLTLLTVMATLVVLSYTILTATVAPAFDDLELAAGETNLVRARRAFQNDLANLGALVGDWAPWDDAYAYARGEYPAFEKSNLNRPTLANLDLDLLAVYDRGANRLWSEVNHQNQVTDLARLGVLNPDHPYFDRLVRHRALDSRTEGLLLTDLGPMLLSSRPILTSSNEGPIAGTMIMGQFFDADRLADLRRRTEVELDAHLLGERSPLDASLQNDIAAAGTEGVRQVISTDSIAAYGLLTDFRGEPLMVLQANTPRQISKLGDSTVNGALLFLSVAGIVVAIVTWLLLRTMIVLPLERLARHITGIRQSGDLMLQLNENRSDEIGALGSEFDQMTKELHHARQLLLEQSFKAGKADTAAEVLHNIRNAMTPLINGIDRLSKNFRSVRRLHVHQATEQLADPACPAERRTKLLQYINSAQGHVEATSESAINELEVASKQARQVEAILRDQEKYANVTPVIESLDLAEVIAEAALVIPNNDQPDIRLQLQPELQQYRVLAHRVGLLQVLGNLILNAYEAILRSSSGEGDIAVTAKFEHLDEQPMIKVTVRDSGCGFGDEVKLNIFQRGFSSKKGHLGGLGLHWCANALAGMGGRIFADSQGPESGAEFHVLLPAA